MLIVTKAAIALSIFKQAQPELGEASNIALTCFVIAWALAGAAVIFLPASRRSMFSIWLAWVDLLVCLGLYAVFIPARISIFGALILSLATIYRSFGFRIVVAAGLFSLAIMLLAEIYAATHWFPILPPLDGDAEISSLISIAAVMLWAAGELRSKQRLEAWGERLEANTGNLAVDPFLHLARQIRDASHATHVAIIWQDDGEHPNFVSTKTGVEDRRPVIDLPALDTRALKKEGQVLPFDGVRNGDLSSAVGMASGLCFPIAIETLTGLVCIETEDRWAILETAQISAIAVKANIFLRNYKAAEAWRNQALVDARRALSRDLHDSILQTLAALRMQIATLIKKGSGGDSVGLIDQLRSLEQAVAGEQGRLRTLLVEVGGAGASAVGLTDALQECAQSAARNWNVRCRVSVASADEQLPRRMASEIELLFREVVANAVRHAQATDISVNAAVQDAELNLVFRDEGTGRAPGRGNLGSDELKSRSLTERLKVLGGQAYSDDLARSTLLSIRIPLHTGSTIAS